MAFLTSKHPLYRTYTCRHVRRGGREADSCRHQIVEAGVLPRRKLGYIGPIEETVPLSLCLRLDRSLCTVCSEIDSMPGIACVRLYGCGPPPHRPSKWKLVIFVVASSTITSWPTRCPNDPPFCPRLLNLQSPRLSKQTSTSLLLLPPVHRPPHHVPSVPFLPNTHVPVVPARPVLYHVPNSTKVNSNARVNAIRRLLYLSKRSMREFGRTIING